MRRAKNGSVPFSHHNIVSIRETVRARAITKTCIPVSDVQSSYGKAFQTFFTLFKLFKETEGARKYSSHDGSGQSKDLILRAIQQAEP
jgi:hypothetical protein